MRWDNDDDNVILVLDKHAELDFYGAKTLKQQSGRRLTCGRVYFNSL